MQPAKPSPSLPATVNATCAQDAHEVLLLLAWRKARAGRNPDWHFEFNVTCAGLPHVNPSLKIKEILTRDEIAAALTAAGAQS